MVNNINITDWPAVGEISLGEVFHMSLSDTGNIGELATKTSFSSGQVQSKSIADT